jgi:hypothetical protein
MNRQNFNQSGGFPLQTETLDQMQKAYGLFNGLGNIAGNFAVISGCEVTGSLVNDGIVFINGELLEFRGGQIGTDVIIVEEVTAQEFEDGNDRDVVYIRYATFGIGGTSFPWANFKRTKTTIELTEQKAEQTVIESLIQRIQDLEDRPAANVPVGLVAIWGLPANTIPAGWEIHEPLEGVFPLGRDPGYDSNTNGDLINYNLNVVGFRGGKREHKLSLLEMPIHGHGISNQSNSAAGSGKVAVGGDGSEGNNPYTDSAGGDKPHTIMSPYVVVDFIRYVG